MCRSTYSAVDAYRVFWGGAFGFERPGKKIKCFCCACVGWMKHGARRGHRARCQRDVLLCFSLQVCPLKRDCISERVKYVNYALSLPFVGTSLSVNTRTFWYLNQYYPSGPYACVTKRSDVYFEGFLSELRYALYHCPYIPECLSDRYIFGQSARFLWGFPVVAGVRALTLSVSS